MRHGIYYQQKLVCLIAQDIQIVMERIPDLLYLKCRTWPRQIPPTEVWLAKGQVQEYAISPSQSPTCAIVREPAYDQRVNVPERWWMIEPKSFVNLFCAVIYDVLWRILCMRMRTFLQGMLQ